MVWSRLQLALLLVTATFCPQANGAGTDPVDAHIIVSPQGSEWHQARLKRRWPRFTRRRCSRVKLWHGGERSELSCVVEYTV